MPNHPSDVTSLLQELIRIPSVNPDDSPGTDQTGEEAVADYVRRYLEAIGFTVTLEQIKPGRPNLIAHAPRPSSSAPDTRPRILFGPHLDTVGVAGMTIDPFSGDISEGKIHGRGASDTKGPMAAMLQALSNCRDLLATLPVAVDFVGFMGEESAQWGSRHFAEHHASDYTFAIIGEPTSLDIVHVTKGSLWATLSTTGKAAHSSQPERGDNAILKLARALDTLDQKLTPVLANFTHPVLGHSTQNIGVITGGSRANIVPDHAQAHIDIRTTPSIFNQGGALKELETFITKNHLPLTITKAHENPPMEVPADHPWIQRLTAIPKNPLQDEELSGEHPSTVGAPWFSDAAHLTTAGLPAICLGPGSIDQAHTKDEFIQIEALKQGTRYFTEMLNALV
jgi:acetylornithine deacetylase